MDASSTIKGPSTRSNLSASKQALLEKRLRGIGKGAFSNPAIPRRTGDAPAPLSFTQQQLWFIDQLEPGTFAYNLPAALRLRGTLNEKLLHQSLERIVDRHEVLRTVFPAQEGEPAQVVRAHSAPPLPVIHLQTFPALEQAAQTERIVAEEMRRPFDLAKGPLVRWQLLRLSEQEHLLLVVMHHIISDGWSMSLFFQELESFYHSLAEGPGGILPAMSLQYADFAAWQQQQFREHKFAGDLAFWKQQLAGAPGAIALPVDFAHASPSHLHGTRLSLRLSSEFRQKMSAFCQVNQSTPFLTLMTALAILLHRWSRQTDLVLGTVVAGRTRREVEKLIGCFMNFLPLRVGIKPDRPGLELLEAVRKSFWDASAHQECPFEKIVEAVNPARKANQNPLYNVGFLMQNWPRSQWRCQDLEVTEMVLEPEAALLDLRWLAEETAEGLTITCEYALNLFEAQTIQALLESFRAVLEALVSHPETPISQFQLTSGLTSQAERARARDAQETLVLTGTFTAEPLEESLRFWAQELALPVRLEFAPYNQVFQQLLDPASLVSANTQGLNVLLLRPEDWLRSASPEESAATGRELLERNARELVQALRQAVTRSATPFLVCLCPGSEGAPAGIAPADVLQTEHWLATELQNISGVHLVTPEDIFTFYPVQDYSNPQADRLGHIPYTAAFFAALGTLIIRKFHALKRPPKKVIAVDCDQTLWSGVCGEDGPGGIGLDDSRLALQHFLLHQYEAGMLLCLCSKNAEEDVWAVFDQHPEMPLRREHLAAWRINWHSKSENLRALATELRLGLDSFILLDDNPVECAEVSATCPDVVALQLPEKPAQIPGFLQHAWIFDHLKLTGEDRNRNQLYQQNRAREELAAQSLSFADFVAGLNLRIRIEDAGEEQLPRVAQLTQRTNQFNCTTQRRTETEIHQLREADRKKVLAVSVQDRFGDYGLVGVILFEANREALEVDTFLLSCRALGKGVEHQMLAHLGQRAAALGLARVDVPFRPSPKNQPALRFLESLGGAPFRKNAGTASVFRFPAEFAANVAFAPQADEWKVLPEQPVPAAAPAGFALGPAFPRCQWIAEQAQDAASILKLILAKAAPQVQSTRSYVAPRSELEQQLCRLWEALLRVPQVGVQDDFFELGGSSILAVQLFAQIEKSFAKSLPLVTLFKAPTVEKLARAMARKKTRAPSSLLMPIQPKGSKPPLVLVHGAGGGLLWGYANLAMKLGMDQPVYAIEPRARTDGPAFQTVEEMARRYVQELCGFQPHGPYYLGGYCFGGYIAYEMACQLRAQEKEVGLLALIDAAAPNGSYDRFQWWRPGLALEFLRNGYYWLENFRRWKPTEQRSFLRRKLHVVSQKILGRLGWKKPDPHALEVEDFIDPSQFPEDELHLWKMHLRAGGEYRPPPYPGRVTLLRTRVQPIVCSFDPNYGWAELAQSGVTVKIISGSHENIFLEPDLQSLAAELQSCLAQSQNHTFVNA